MRWTIKAIPSEEKIKELCHSLNISKTIALLLLQRGIHHFNDAKDFFRPNLNQLHDPFLMKDMNKAVARIEEAVQKNEHILVYGDYDVDGTTSVALMSSYLKSTYPNVSTYIPDRYNEGYGISYQGIDFASNNKVSLIIALDCGIKATDKVLYASKKGIDFIICDHHLPADSIPKAIAVLDPKREDCAYPYKELCGCGVGFKLIQAITIKKQGNLEELTPYLDLVATAIAADIVPITGENRILAHHGLKIINSKPRVGFQAIIKQTNKEILTITDVVFIIAPRINAAGRMKHGNHAVTLLTETDMGSATIWAKEIEEYNLSRKEADKKTTQEALRQIKNNNESEKMTTVVYDKNWHKGVIGIVASRLTETYYRPTLVFTKSGDKLAASARSVKGFNVYKALAQCTEYLEQFGGHKYAAGLTMLEENYEAFKIKFEEVVSQSISPELLIPEIEIDAQINLADITPKFYRILKQFAPFGPSNRNPVFITPELQDTGYGRKIGKEKEHLRISVKQETSQTLTAIGFGIANKFELTTNKKLFQAAYTINENKWKGTTTLQLQLKDLR